MYNYIGNGVGDDLYSFGFDGAYLWTGGKSTLVIPSVSQPHVKKGDNIGIALDLTVPIITFFLNGMKVPGYFRNFNLDGMFFPVVSASSKISCRFLFGGDHGRLKYAPPENFSPLFECLLPAQQLYIDPGFYFGELHKTILSGPLALNDDVAFVPNPVDTTTIQLQPFVENIRDKLAENIHEMWAVTKIETGWTYGDIRDDNMMSHPCLTQFQNLPTAEKRYNIQLGLQTMKTIVALGYNISMDKPPARIRPVRLPNDPYLQPNGYKPAPLDLSAIELTSKMEELVDRLAENTHNVWARERISQGWTYGLNEDSEKRRSPHLVSYKDVDEVNTYLFIYPYFPLKRNFCFAIRLFYIFFPSPLKLLTATQVLRLSEHFWFMDMFWILQLVIRQLKRARRLLAKGPNLEHIG